MGKEFVGSGFCICAGKIFEISLGATVVQHSSDGNYLYEFCFMNTKAASIFLFDVFMQSNKEGFINYLKITNKFDLPFTV